MPYRVDIPCPPSDALDVLVQLGALDIELVEGGLAAIMPDGVEPQRIASELELAGMTISEAARRDDGSVWLLSPRTVRIGNVVIASPEIAAGAGTLRLNDSAVFGTGHHPTTLMCVQALEELLTSEAVASILDVGTGSGILALTALMMGVPYAVGLDTDKDAIGMAAENARLNNFADRLRLLLGGPEVVDGQWPLVVANVLAAPLIEMAPDLVRRVGRRGRLMLSGIPSCVGAEVKRSYQHLGMHHVRSDTQSGWTMLMMQASW